jgi:hypothetical protein
MSGTSVDMRGCTDLCGQHWLGVEACEHLKRGVGVYAKLVHYCV